MGELITKANIQAYSLHYKYVYHVSFKKYVYMIL